MNTKPLYCYFKDSIMKRDKTHFELDDIGILRGYAVFDFIKCYNGQPFLLKEHLERLHRSAQTMNIRVSLSDSRITEIIKGLLKKNTLTKGTASIRIVLTGGETIDGLSYNPSTPTFYILTEPAHDLPKKLYTQGGTLITHEHERPFSSIKSTHYITAVKLQHARKKAKAVEILYTHNGELLEGTTSNFFIIKGTTLITPKDNILIGITRNFVLSLARDAGLTIDERPSTRPITFMELQKASEAFITATNKEIVPIVKVDAQIVGDGQVGEKTRQLMKMYQEKVSSL